MLYHIYRPVRQKKGAHNRSLWLLAFDSLLFAMGTINVGCNTKMMQLSFIDNRAYPGGPNAWFFAYYSDNINTTGNISYIIANFLADGLLVGIVRLREFTLRILNMRRLALENICRVEYALGHRFPFCCISRVYWSASNVDPYLPRLTRVLAMSIMVIFQSSRPNASLWTSTTVQFSLPYFAISIALNVMLTLLLVSRLLYMSHQAKKTIGMEHGDAYISVASMLIQSATQYAITGLVFIITYARSSNVQNLILPVLSQIMVRSGSRSHTSHPPALRLKCRDSQGWKLILQPLQCISPEVIILRVATGRAVSTANPTGTVTAATRRKESTMRFHAPKSDLTQSYALTSMAPSVSRTTQDRSRWAPSRIYSS